jgi:hypothetical protein
MKPLIRHGTSRINGFGPIGRSFQVHAGMMQPINVVVLTREK